MAGAQNPEIIQKLLAAGADPHLSDSANTWGAGALQYAVGNPESLRLLLEEIKDPGQELGITGGVGFYIPYTYNSYEDEPPTVDLVAMRVPPRWWAVGSLLVATWAGDSASAEMLLEAGRVEWAGDLVESGFDPAHRDILGRDLLVRALDELIPPRLADMRGDNLPQVNKPELAKFLIAQGLSPKPERLVGQPLWTNHLLAAIQDQDSELITTLIQAGASLDAPDHSGKTALIYVTQNQDLDLVKALLEAGAKPNRSDLEDKTALDYAREMGNQELAELLAGAKP